MTEEEGSAQCSVIAALPADTQRSFFGYLDAKSLLDCMAVCREWRAWSATAEAWTAVYCTSWRKGIPLPSGFQLSATSAMEMYKRRHLALGKDAAVDADIPYSRQADNSFAAVNNQTQQGIGMFSDNVAALQSANPLLPIVSLEACCRSVLYFEATVFGGSSVGLQFPAGYGGWKGSHIGWRNRSYGYHSDDGKFYWNEGQPFHFDGEYEDYGETYGEIDGARVHQTVGCGFDIDKQEVFFTLDGSMMGVARRQVEPHSFHAAVGLHSQGDSVVINLGGAPFHFDIETYCLRT